MNILISACLLGQYCRYDGCTKSYPAIMPLLKCTRLHIIPICPEQCGGLATPREPSERLGDKVLTKSGRDVTEAYGRGAAEAVKLAKLFHCKVAVLKEKSPSCGCGRIYDGSFSHTIVDGDGVTAEYLRREGVRIIGETDREGIENLLRGDE